MRILIIIAFVTLLFPSVGITESLYRDDSYRALTSDRRAHRIGDILTVLVLENSSASATAGTNTDKSNDIGIKFLSPNSQKDYALGIQEDFEGNGKIARSGKLLAQLSVTVVDIDANNDLHIKGEQQIEINDEKQAITLEGRVRQVDISEGNAVVSNRIADAKITYVGDGVLAEAQHKGWLSRLISILGLL